MTCPAPRINPTTQSKRLHRVCHSAALLTVAGVGRVSMALLCVWGAQHATAGAVDAAGVAATPHTADAADCEVAASAECYQTLQMPGQGGNLHYYASLRAPGGTDAEPSAHAPPNIAAPTRAPTRALIALHGHSRDANKTFDAALRAVRAAHAAGAATATSGAPTGGTGATGNTLVIAPLFQVAADRAQGCSTAGVPQAQNGDLLWTCASWMQGGRARNGDNNPSAFEVLDTLVDYLSTRWPSLQTITIAGFSAGGQMVQRYVNQVSLARLPLRS